MMLSRENQELREDRPEFVFENQESPQDRPDFLVEDTLNPYLEFIGFLSSMIAIGSQLEEDQCSDGPQGLLWLCLSHVLFYALPYIERAVHIQNRWLDLRVDFDMEMRSTRLRREDRALPLVVNGGVSLIPAYQLFGLNRSATLDVVKRRYRELALQFHPDKNASSEAAEKFKKINAAYQALSNPELETKQLTDGERTFIDWSVSSLFAAPRLAITDKAHTEDKKREHQLKR